MKCLLLRSYTHTKSNCTANEHRSRVLATKALKSVYKNGFFYN